MYLWKENRLDKRYDMGYDEIYNKFIGSEEFKKWKNHETKSNLYYSLIWFITDKNGLNSAFEKDDFEKLYDVVEMRINNEMS